MFKMVHRSELESAEKYGSCVSCGQERDVFNTLLQEFPHPL